ncbi:uncharacterized protein [Temnothorax nylanderi]|uniref:uncharacterized protein n=1 Tax=Temnothorax nylanderi TaxID=102681 RepID=UPI003A83D8CD
MSSLKWLMSFKDLEGQLARWLERLQQFEFSVVHRKGFSHKNCRTVYQGDCVRWKIVSIVQVERKSFQGQEEDCCSNLLRHWKSGTLAKGAEIGSGHFFNLQAKELVVPRSQAARILEEAHDSSSGGHFGMNKTLSKIRRRFYWATCKRDVETGADLVVSVVAKRGPSDKDYSLHPQSDGQVERQHQTITNFLAKFVSENQKDWDRWIPMFPTGI